MRSLLVAAVCALALAAGCGDIPTQSVTVRPSLATSRPALSAWSPGLGAPLAFTLEVAANDRTAHWYAVGTWNRTLQIQASKVQPKPRTVVPPRSKATHVAPTGPCGGWGDLVASLWPANEVANACRRLMCESGGDPNARNRSGAIGLFQLLGHGGTTDPVQNATVAYRLWLSEGWSPWACK